MCAHPRALTLRLLCFPLPAQPTFQKNTNVWSDHKDTVEIFVQQDGKTMKKECDHTKGQVCPFYKMHANLRPGKGEKGCADRGSIYPDSLCFLLLNAGTSLFGKVRMQDLDPAYFADGHVDKCSGCNNLERGGKVYLCANCSHAYHWSCMPAAIAKPKNGQEWYCPKQLCQAKAEAVAAAADV